MPEPTNPSIDIEELMVRIQKEVALRRRSASPTSTTGNIASYTPGSVIEFGTAGNESIYLRSGWAEPENGFRWTEGETADLAFAFDRPPGDLVLTFQAHPLLGGGVEVQEISATWNGTLVGVWSVRETGSYNTLVLAHVSESSPSALLRFHLPQSFTPVSKSLSRDPRRLGLAFSKLVLRPTAEVGFKHEPS